MTFTVNLPVKCNLRLFGHCFCPLEIVATVYWKMKSKREKKKGKKREKTLSSSCVFSGVACLNCNPGSNRTE